MIFSAFVNVLAIGLNSAAVVMNASEGNWTWVAINGVFLLVSWVCLAICLDN